MFRFNMSVILLGLFMLLSCAPDPIAEEQQQNSTVDKEEVPPEEQEDVENEDSVTDSADVQIEWEDALTAVRNMNVGWNLGNTLDSHGEDAVDGEDWRKWETYWGQPVTNPELFQMLKAAGFDAMRIPVTWGIHMDDKGTVFPSWMNRVHEIVDYVLNAGMYCILNIHHDTGAGEDAWLIADPLVYEQVKQRYEGLWRQIAEEFKDYGEKLLFESFNEMLDSRRSWCFSSFNGGYDEAYAADAYKAINDYAQSFVDVVRQTGGNNAVRNLVVNTYGACCGAGTWNSHLKDPLIYMDLPEDKIDNHLIFEVHTYPSVKSVQSAKAEVDDMFQALQTHLVSKGAPVIIGEWGTSNSEGESDYLVRRENVLEFATYFVQKAKAMDFGTFYWMGLTNGPDRTIPVFTQPDLAETIVKAYHGESYQGTYPSIDDYICEYVVTYSKQWSELNLISNTISLDDYSEIRLTLDEAPAKDAIHVKIYGKNDGEKQNESYIKVDASESTIIPDPEYLVGVWERITLQYCQNSPPYTVTVKDVSLVKKDGTVEKGAVSTFWGCTMELKATKK